MSEDYQAVTGSTVRHQTMADGTLRLVIDLDARTEDEQTDAFRAIGQRGTALAIARLSPEAAERIQREQMQAEIEQRQAREAEQEAERERRQREREEAENTPEAQEEKRRGQLARALKQSGFFRVKQVWEAIGTDEQFLAWIRRQPSAATGKIDWDEEMGESRNEPAHVRRIANGAGTAERPPYSAIPLTHEEHRRQHQEGESAIGPKEWWDEQRIRFVEKWAWEAVKAQLGVASMRDMDPQDFVGWAVDEGLDRFLPREWGDEINRFLQGAA